MNPCPFCREKNRLGVIVKQLRTGTAGYVHYGAYCRCKKCKARGPLVRLKTHFDVRNESIGKDDLRVLAFALEYLTQQRSVVEKMAENLNRDGIAASVTNEKGVRTEAATPGDRRCERNMKRDRVAYVRTDITGCADGIHVKLSVMNPRVVVGNAEPFVGIERDPHYFDIASRRIAEAKQLPPTTTQQELPL